jgi:hypothetical protein
MMTTVRAPLIRAVRELALALREVASALDAAPRRGPSWRRSSRAATRWLRLDDLC